VGAGFFTVRSADQGLMLVVEDLAAASYDIHCGAEVQKGLKILRNFRFG
jgi:hypothetical protein